MRYSMRKSSPHTSLIFLHTMMGKRARFSMEPPYSSVRWLNSGEMNWLSSQPWPPWRFTIWKPSALQFHAASAHWAAVFSIISTVISSTCTPSSRTKAEGPMGFLWPGMVSGWFMAPTWLSWMDATAP